MAPPATAQKQSRRRKKRRTQDSSSESSSDSSDHSDSEVESRQRTSAPESVTEKKPEYDIDDINIDSDQEKEDSQTKEIIPEVTLKQMEAVKFTTTENQPLAEAKDQVKRDRQQLESDFLSQMATTFSTELDELRQKPDFSDKSIVLLAKTLQSGSNMFDEETLEALLNK